MRGDWLPRSAAEGSGPPGLRPAPARPGRLAAPRLSAGAIPGLQERRLGVCSASSARSPGPRGEESREEVKARAFARWLRLECALGPGRHGWSRHWSGARPARRREAGTALPAAGQGCPPPESAVGKEARSLSGAPLFARACGRAFGDRDPGPSLRPGAAGKLGGPELRRGEVSRGRAGPLSSELPRGGRRAAMPKPAGAGRRTASPAGLRFRLVSPNLVATPRLQRWIRVEMLCRVGSWETARLGKLSVSYWLGKWRQGSRQAGKLEKETSKWGGLCHAFLWLCWILFCILKWQSQLLTQIPLT